MTSNDKGKKWKELLGSGPTKAPFRRPKGGLSQAVLAVNTPHPRLVCSIHEQLLRYPHPQAILTIVSEAI